MKRSMCILAAASVAGIFAASTSAATIGYWRFEGATTGSPAPWLSDSSGNNNTLTRVSTPDQEAIPVTGAGSKFSNPVPRTGEANASMANLVSTLEYFSAGDPFAPSAITLEAFVTKTATPTGTQYFISQWHTSAPANARSYALGVTGSSGLTGTSGNVAADRLFVTLSNNGSATTLTQDSGLTFNPNVDYYAAMTYDPTDTLSGLKFYLKDLTNNGALQVATFGQSVGTLNNSSGAIQIGGYSNGGRWDGKLDEVRISDTALVQSDLLIVPEPASLALLSLAGLTMLRRRR